MNPRLVLQLWRERWGKAEQGYAQKIYVSGAVSAWLQKIPYSIAWNKLGVTWIAMLLCIVFLGVVSQINFSLNGQITFAGLMVASAMYLRRIKGPVVTLTLTCLSLVCCSQYVTWRLEQSIIDQTGTAFLWAFILGSAEVCVAIFLGIGWIIHIWPMEQKELKISANENDYPSIDLVLTCAGAQDQAAIWQINAAAELNWPTNKIRIFVTDSQNRQSLKQLAETLGANFNETLASNITIGTGELIVLVEVKNDDPTLLPNAFLQSTIGWFIDDTGLALLSDSKHFLAHKPCEQIAQKYNQSTHNRAIVRRSELPTGQAATNAALKAKLQKQSALLIEDFSPQADGQKKYIRIDRADSAAITRCRRMLFDLHQMLRFYSPLITLLFFIAPLANLFGGVKLLQASISWWAAFFVPCLALLAITEERCRGNYRLGTIKEIKDIALSAYFLLPTAKSFLKTKFANPVVAFTRFREDQNRYEFIRSSGIYALFWANFLGALSGFLKLTFGTVHQSEWTIFFCFWAVTNAALLLAKKAIDHEASEVKYFAKNRGILKGALRMPFGRTLVCETINFPSSQLTLRAPVAIDLNKNAQTQIVLQHQHKSYTLHARILDLDNRNCTVLIGEESQVEYQALKDAVFARSVNWPQWLPHQGADKPFPAWVYRLVSTISGKSADLLAYLTTNPGWEIFIQLWKKQK